LIVFKRIYGFQRAEKKAANPIFFELDQCSLTPLVSGWFASGAMLAAKSEMAMKTMIEESNWAPFVSAIVIVTIALAIILWLWPFHF
jgi:hypothetical protein